MDTSVDVGGVGENDAPTVLSDIFPRQNPFFAAYHLCLFLLRVFPDAPLAHVSSRFVWGGGVLLLSTPRHTPMHATLSHANQIFDGTSTDAAKTMEALELSEALQRVRSSRRGRRDNDRERRGARDTEARPRFGDERKEPDTVGKRDLPGRGGSCFLCQELQQRVEWAVRTESRCHIYWCVWSLRSSASYLIGRCRREKKRRPDLRQNHLLLGTDSKIPY